MPSQSGLMASQIWPKRPLAASPASPPPSDRSCPQPASSPPQSSPPRSAAPSPHPRRRRRPSRPIPRRRRPRLPSRRPRQAGPPRRRRWTRRRPRRRRRPPPRPPPLRRCTFVYELCFCPGSPLPISQQPSTGPGCRGTEQTAGSSWSDRVIHTSVLQAEIVSGLKDRPGYRNGNRSCTCAGGALRCCPAACLATLCPLPSLDARILRRVLHVHTSKSPSGAMTITKPDVAASRQGHGRAKTWSAHVSVGAAADGGRIADVEEEPYRWERHRHEKRHHTCR